MTEPAPDGGDPLRVLLAALGPEPGPAYEALRARLIDMFRWRGLARAEELADTTLDRAARKLAEGAPLTASVAAYVAGIARLVALEAGRAARREQPFSDDSGAQPAAPRADRPDPAADRCLERCLGEQPAAAREVLLRYVAATQGRARIDARRKLADELGVELNALRVRVHRIRTQVEACLRDCLGNVSGSIDMGEA